VTSPNVNATGAKKCHGRLDISSLPISIPKTSLVARLQRWYRHSALRVLLAECCSLRHRIRWVLEIRAVERQHGKGSVHEWIYRESVPWRQIYTPAYIRYMQQIEFRHPFLSIFDLHLVSQAWKAGLGYDNRICTSQNLDKSQACIAPEGGNSMSPEAVQQSTKCDPSSPEIKPRT
jgi:hypothetical protein